MGIIFITDAYESGTLGGASISYICFLSGGSSQLIEYPDYDGILVMFVHNNVTVDTKIYMLPNDNTTAFYVSSTIYTRVTSNDINIGQITINIDSTSKYLSITITHPYMGFIYGIKL